MIDPIWLTNWHQVYGSVVFPESMSGWLSFGAAAQSLNCTGLRQLQTTLRQRLAVHSRVTVVLCPDIVPEAWAQRAPDTMIRRHP